MRYSRVTKQIAKFVGPTWGPSGADRTQVGPMLAPWTLLSGASSVTTFWLQLLMVDVVSLGHLEKIAPMALSKMRAEFSRGGSNPVRIAIIGIQNKTNPNTEHPLTHCPLADAQTSLQKCFWTIVNVCILFVKYYIVVLHTSNLGSTLP